MICPVVWLDLSDKRNATMLAISSVVVILFPNGIFEVMDSILLCSNISFSGFVHMQQCCVINNEMLF